MTLLWLHHWHQHYDNIDPDIDIVILKLTLEKHQMQTFLSNPLLKYFWANPEFEYFHILLFSNLQKSLHVIFARWRNASN